MSNWTHAQCEACWIENELVTDEEGRVLIRQPTRVTDVNARMCCFCGRLTISGIFRRHDPALLTRCLGHEQE